MLLAADACQRFDYQGRIDASGLELRAGDTKIGVDDGDVLAEVDALGIGVDFDHLELRSAHVDRQLLALEIGERLDRFVLGEDHQIGEREAGADDAQRNAFLIKLLEDRRPADQRVGLAGGEARVERGDRRIGVNIKLEAVFGVEAARLHDVPHQRIEHRQRQAGDLDHRLLLRQRGRRGKTDNGKSDNRRQRGETASRHFEHEDPPVDFIPGFPG